MATRWSAPLVHAGRQARDAGLAQRPLARADSAAPPERRTDSPALAAPDFARLNILSTAQAGALPDRTRIQRSFGRHALGDIRAHTGPAAEADCRARGALAWASGRHIVLGQPSLFNAAHEAAHVVQQRAAPGHVAEADVAPFSDPEQHADAVARAVVDGRSAEPLLDAAPRVASGALQMRADPAAAEQAREAKQQKDTTSDLDAILAAGQRERDAPGETPATVTNGASIVYRMLRIFRPELARQWWVAGVGGSGAVSGLKLTLSGTKDLQITVGRDFILATDEARLPDRVADLDRAFTALELRKADKKDRSATEATQDNKPPSLAEAIEEGGRLFSAKADFGVTAGSAAGPDADDGYDASHWKEDGRAIVATVEPWLAMSAMVRSVGAPVPKKGGGTTRWRFDCFEGMDVVRKYAEWRTTSRRAFNTKFNPLRIGFMAYLREGAVDLEKPIQSDKPGGAPYTKGEEVATTKPDGSMAFEPKRIPAGPSMQKVLADAPVGSYVCFTNADITARLLSHSKRLGEGAAIDPKEQALVDRITPWNSENALKIGPDRYSAFPLGVKSAAEIMQALADIVFEPNAPPPGYIQRNVYISSVAKRKP